MLLVGVDVRVKVATGNSQVLADTIGLNLAGTITNSINRQPAQSLHEATTGKTKSTVIIDLEITDVQVSSKNNNGLGRVSSTDGLDDGGGLGPTDRDMSDDEVHVNVLLEGFLEPGEGDGEVGGFDDGIVGGALEVVQESITHHTS